MGCKLPYYRSTPAKTASCSNRLGQDYCKNGSSLGRTRTALVTTKDILFIRGWERALSTRNVLIENSCCISDQEWLSSLILSPLSRLSLILSEPPNDWINFRQFRQKCFVFSKLGESETRRYSPNLLGVYLNVGVCVCNDSGCEDSIKTDNVYTQKHYAPLKMRSKVVWFFCYKNAQYYFICMRPWV